MKTLYYPEKVEEVSITEEEYEEQLNNTYGTVNVCGYEYDAGSLLKDIDPTAFNCGYSDVVEIEIKYECPICGEMFDERLEAIECCQSEFICSECGEIHDTEKEAENCCKDEDENE